MRDPNCPVLDWPLSSGEPGREVWYGLVSPQDASVAFWYRYTLLSTEAGHREGRVWAALTDRGDEDTTFLSESFPVGAVVARGDPFSLKIGDAALTSSSTAGSVGDLSWDLEYDPDTYVFTPLRSQRLTRLLSAVAGTGRHWSRNESVAMSGTVTVGDRTVEFADAPGHQGHTLGTSPPDSWVWVQCNDFEDPSLSLECLNLEGRLSVCLRRDGEVHALNRLRDVVGPGANGSDYERVGDWQFRARGEGVELTATVRADPDHWQRVAYRAPDGTLRYNAHCSLSDVTLTYSVDESDPRTATSSAGRSEWVHTSPPVPGDYRPDWADAG